MSQGKEIRYACVGFYDIYVFNENYDEIIKDVSSFVNVEIIKKTKLLWVYFDDAVYEQDDDMQKVMDMLEHLEKYFDTPNSGIKIRALV